MAASARYVSFTQARRQRRFETKKPEDSDSFSEVEQKHLTSAPVLTVHMITILLHIFQ